MDNSDKNLMIADAVEELLDEIEAILGTKRVGIHTEVYVDNEDDTVTKLQFTNLNPATMEKLKEITTLMEFPLDNDTVM